MTQLSITGGTEGLSSGLSEILERDFDPGTSPSYELCKLIYTNHPLGQKMAEAPVNMAQSQQRKVTVQGAPDEVVKEYVREWAAVEADAHIHNVGRLARVYGISSLVLGCEGVAANKPLDMAKLWKLPIYFSVLDPLNTAGSLVLNQVSTDPDFLKVVAVRTGGQSFHPTRFRVLMNEAPVFLAYTDSAFGFVGRSVYQRALYPLKSFIRTMIADDMIATKLALLVAKQETPGSIVDNIMEAASAIKRVMLKFARSGEVLSIGKEEEIETLNMQNVDGAGTYSRTNILKNIATSADMPAKLLENETMVAGFGEGVEDAKNIARYIERVRMWLQPAYAWFDNVVQYRAWNPDFYKRIQALYPDGYGAVSYEDAFSTWRAAFAAEWPSILIEPESEKAKVSSVKLEAVLAACQTFLPELDPESKTLLIQSALDNINEDKTMFAYSLEINAEALTAHLEEQKEQQQQMAEQAQDPDQPEKVGGVAKKLGRFDSAGGLALARLSAAVARLPVRSARQRPDVKQIARD